MPRIGSGGAGFKNGNMSLVDSSGKVATVTMNRLGGSVTEAQVTALQNAIGDLSNAGEFKRTYSGSTEKAKTAVTAYDEAESSVTTGANFTFQNTTTLATRIFRVPAIDADAIGETGEFVESGADNAQVQALIDAALVVLGSGWVFVSAPISTHGRAGGNRPTKPLIAEPATGALPPPEPAV